MDFGTLPHASFIPKKPIAPATPASYGRHNMPLMTLLSTIIFIAALALAGGVFAYERYLDSSLAAKKTQLEQARGSFELPTIKEMERADKRIEFAKGLLANHSAFSALFDVLQKSTLQNVQYTNMDLGANGSAITLTLKGIAKSYASVALQSDLFNTARGIKHPVFSDLNLDQKGNVVFTVTSELDPEVFSYTQLVGGAGAETPAESAGESSAPAGFDPFGSGVTQ
jgi:hypothetical protein